MIHKGVVETDNMVDTLSRLFLFEGMEREEILWKLALVQPKREVYRRGETLCEPQQYRRALFVIAKGECDVTQGDEDGRVVLNTLRAGDSFGIVSLFSQRTVFPTTVTARRETEVIVLSRADVERMMNVCPAIGINIISFLTDRVEFLNDRVASLTESTVERKVAGYLLAACPPEGEPVVSINRKHTAEALHCGRASLYRVLDALKEKGFIACEGSKIRVISREGLERIMK